MAVCAYGAPVSSVHDIGREFLRGCSANRNAPERAFGLCANLLAVCPVPIEKNPLSGVGRTSSRPRDIMNAEMLEAKFARMGARLAVGELIDTDDRRSRLPLTLDVRPDEQ